jgi:hypothetical protein
MEENSRFCLEIFYNFFSFYLKLKEKGDFFKNHYVEYIHLINKKCILKQYLCGH